jgi:hypothetical protein
MKVNRSAHPRRSGEDGGPGSRPSRRWGRAACALVLAAGAASVPSALAAVTPAQTSGSTLDTSFTAPSTRALALGLEVPSSQADPDHPACAVDVVDATTACFGSQDEVSAYIAGDPVAASQAMAAAGAVLPAGFGGTQTVPNPGHALGKTCEVASCNSGVVTKYFAPNESDCTHSYPNNDYFHNSDPVFHDYVPDPNQVTLQCSRVVIYPGATQQGKGALNCFNYSPCADPINTYQSISWHFN